MIRIGSVFRTLHSYMNVTVFILNPYFEFEHGKYAVYRYFLRSIWSKY